MARDPAGATQVVLVYQEGRLHGVQRWYRGGSLALVQVYEQGKPVAVAPEQAAALGLTPEETALLGK